jgi:hypothetical protein
MKKQHAKRGADDFVAEHGLASVNGARRDPYEPPDDPKINLKLRQVAKILEDVHEGADPTVIADAFRRVVTLLHGAERLTILIAKAMCAAKAKLAKILKPARFVDELFRSLEAEPASPTHTASKLGALLNEPEPWPEPVGAEVLDELRETIARYVVVPTGADVLATLWVILTYLIDSTALDISPILAVISPTKRCGKSTLLTVLGALALKALPASSISAAALYRAVEAFRPTLIVDECDTFLPENPELRGIVNGAHIKSMAYVVRVNGETLEPEVFSSWCAKVIAMIGHPPPTIEDRSIVLTLRRRTRSEAVTRLRAGRLHDELADTRRRLVRWARDHEEAFAAADPVMPDHLHDRAQDNLRPLLQIATAAGPSWLAKAYDAIAAIYQGAQAGADTEEGIELLSDIRELLGKPAAYVLMVRHNRKGEPVMVVPGELCRELVALDECPWKTRERGFPITVYWLGRMLAEFRVWRRSFRIDGTVVHGYGLARLKEAFERYLPPPGAENPAHPSQDNDSEDLGENTGPGTNEPYRFRENRASAREKSDVTGVPVSDPSPEGDSQVF